MKKSEFYRMLKVSEVKKIMEAIPKSDYQVAFKTAVYTGIFAQPPGKVKQDEDCF